MINKLKCNISLSLIDAWRVINDNAKGFVFITGENNKLLGILTDGDVRRFLLSKGSLNAGIEQAMNKDFVYGHIRDSHKSLQEKISHKIKIIPLVDDDFSLVDYYEYKTEFNIPVALPDLQGKELSYLTDAFLSTWISSSGEYIHRFEKGFSEFCGSQFGIAVSNGTVAIHLALAACGIGEGDEVIVPDLTFAATINAVLHAHAKPVIVDVEPESWCIDPAEIEKAISPKTKAIIPVHLYGQTADMDPILVIAKKHNLIVIEDAAEAHGALYKGKKAGSMGDIGTFSFYGNKVITTGEGGMCITNHAELNDKMRVLRDHGMSKTKRYWHEFVGYNYRMTNLQASIGVAQLERIETILKERRAIEDRYRHALSAVKQLKFQNDNLEGRKKITWLTCALVDKDRDKFMNEMKQKGIDTRPFFYPLSAMPIYKDFVFSNKNAMEISARGVNFPTNQQVTDDMLNCIKEYFNE